MSGASDPKRLKRMARLSAALQMKTKLLEGEQMRIGAEKAAIDAQALSLELRCGEGSFVDRNFPDLIGRQRQRNRLEAEQAGHRLNVASDALRRERKRAEIVQSQFEEARARMGGYDLDALIGLFDGASEDDENES